MSMPTPVRAISDAGADTGQQVPNASACAPEVLAKTAGVIRNQDWTGKDLEGRDFHGKTFVDVKFNGARLETANLVNATFCDVDFSDSDLRRAKLDRAYISANSTVSSADFTSASARGIHFDVIPAGLLVDDADFRDATIGCPDDGSQPACEREQSPVFSSLKNANFAGATLGTFPFNNRDLASTHLDNAVLPAPPPDALAHVIAAMTPHGVLTFEPGSIWTNGKADRFSYPELKRLATIMVVVDRIGRMPSFDCAKAATKAEIAICGSPKLAVLDKSMTWLWSRAERNPAQTAAQQAWLGSRAACGGKDMQRCLTTSYIARIVELAPDAKSSTIGNAVYSGGIPYVPEGADGELVKRFEIASGFSSTAASLSNWTATTGDIETFWYRNAMDSCGQASDKNARRVGSAIYLDESAGEEPGDARKETMYVVTPYTIVSGPSTEEQGNCNVSIGNPIFYRSPDFAAPYFPQGG